MVMETENWEGDEVGRSVRALRVADPSKLHGTNSGARRSIRHRSEQA